MTKLQTISLLLLLSKEKPSPEKDLSASIKFIVFFVQGLPGSVGEKGEKGDSAGDIVGAKVSQ